MKKNIIKIINFLILEVFILSFVLNCTSLDNIINDFEVNTSKINKLNNVKGSDDIIPHHLNHNVVFNFKDKDEIVLNNIVSGKNNNKKNNGSRIVARDDVRGKNVPFDDSVMKNAVIAESNSHNVTPDESVVIKYKDVKLEIPVGAVKEETDIVIEELDEVAKLNAGMNNITKSVSGYRFLPDGMKFEKMVRVTIPFNKEEIQNDDDLWSLYTYFYNEETKKWEKLQRVDINEEEGTISSLTNHFTDLINSTLKLPESPKPMNFNPTSIKDIKAANPLAGISQIEGLEANSNGTASFSLPLNIPPGRNGMSPDLALSYSSGIANDLYGVGFNIDIPYISIDTKFGLPKYNGKDTYLINGQELVEVDKIGNDTYYKTRVEGGFSRIIRKGSSADNYYFEITAKDGTKQIFGTEESKLGGSNGIFKWYIKEITSLNGNTITYYYDEEDGYNYIQNIIYTGHTSGEQGKYRIHFVRGSREDKIIDCRGKFKSVLKDRIEEIDIFYINDIVRKYKFNYEYNDFYKSSITKMTETDGDDNEFYSYDFDYYEMEKQSDGVKGFEKTQSWDDAEQSLNVSQTISGGGSCYVGLGWFYNLAFGVNLGFGLDFSNSFMKFVDINGDGLPDQVGQSIGSSDWFYRENLGESGGFSNPKTLHGFSGVVDFNTQTNFDFGLSGSVGPLSTSIGASFSFTNSFSTFADINGDGLIDFVPGIFRSDYLKNIDGEFSPQQWIIEDNNEDDIVFNNNVSSNEYSDEFESAFHLLDPVVKWIPYHTGKIIIESEAEKIDDLEVEEPGDGVRLELYRNNNLENETVLKNGDGKININKVFDVAKSDNIYFKVSSVKDINNDKVKWNPVVKYENIYIHEDLGNYDIAYIKSYYTPEYFDDIILAKISDESYKDFVSNVCYTAEKDPENEAIITGYSLNELNKTDEERLKNIFIESNLVIPKLIKKEFFENSILTQDIFSDDNDYLVDYNDPERENVYVDKDKYYFTSVYSLDIAGKYYVLKKSVNNDKIFNDIILNITLNNNWFEHNYEYNGVNKNVLKDNTDYYVFTQNDLNITDINILPADDIEEIGNISEKGVLVERIVKDTGDITKKWIKDDGSRIVLTINDINGETEKIVNIDPSVTGSCDENVLSITEKSDKYKKEYVLYENDIIPLIIEENIYLSLYETKLEEPIEESDFENLLLEIETAGLDKTLIEDSYDFVPDEYVLKSEIVNDVKHEILNIFDAVGFIESYYTKNNTVYELDETYDSDYINNLLSAEKIKRYSVIKRDINILQTGLYDVEETVNTGESEDEVSFDTHEVNKNNSSGYILIEDFDNTGNTVENKKFIHIFNLQNDFNLTDLNPNPDDYDTTLNDNDYYKRVVEYFGGGIYNWFYGEYNGNLDWNEDDIGHKDESKNYVTFIKMVSKSNDFRRELPYDLGYSDVRVEENLLKIDIWHGTESKYLDRGFDEKGEKYEEEKYFTSYVSYDEFCPTRKGGDLKDKAPTGNTTISLGGDTPNKSTGQLAGGLGDIGTSFAWGFNSAISVGLFGLNMNIGESYCFSGILDINGDRYPDKIIFPMGFPKMGAIINGGGGYNSYQSYEGLHPFFRKNITKNIGIGVSAGPTGSWMKPDLNDEGEIVGAVPNKSSSGSTDVSGSVKFTGNIGESLSEIDFIDMNGDGLLDHVKRSGSGGFDVRLNTGDGFEGASWDADNWSGAVLSNTSIGGESLGNPNYLSYANNVAGGVSLGIGIYNVGLNLGITASGNRTKTDLIDMNGDGLPDMVFKTNNLPYFAVRYNLGDRFADASEEVHWYTPDWQIGGDGFKIDGYIQKVLENIIGTLFMMNGGGHSFRPSFNLSEFNNTISFAEDIAIMGAGDVISFTGSFTVSAGFNFTIDIGPLGPTFLHIYITPGGDFSYGQTGGKLDMVDIDGDGLPDHVFKSDIENFCRVKINNSKKVGLLKNIKTPAGGNIALEYERTPNSVDMPNSQYVLTNVTKSGTFEKNADGSEKTYNVNYSYEDGKYDRYERDFYGFSKITITNPDNSFIINEYCNENYYNRGILHHTGVYDTNGDLFSELVNNYSFTLSDDRGDKNVIFPELISTRGIQYDLVTGEILETLFESQCDDYGNVVYAVDRGDVKDLNDDLYITITYDSENHDKYIMSNPELLEVRDNEGELLRTRSADYYTDGNLRSITQYVEDEVNKISDSYTTVFTYDSYGNFKTMTDPKGYCVEYFYDDKVNTYVVQTSDSGAGYSGYNSFADYDYALGVNISTTDLNGNVIRRKPDSFGRIKAVWTDYDIYNPDTDSGTPAVKFEYYQNEYPARAVTKNKIHFDPNDSETLDTVIIIDGLERVLQTKKEGEFANETCTDTEYGMNVSGKVIHDAMGRVIKAGTPVKQVNNTLSKLTNDPAGLYGYYADIQLNNPTETEYDSQGRAVKTILPDDNEIKVEYMIEDGIFKTTVSDPKENNKISYTDIKENILKIEQFNKYSTDTLETITTSYKYDLLGQITDVIDTEGNTTRITYDSLGRRTSINNPDSGLVIYKYDEGSNLTEKTDPNLRSKSQKIKYNYDIAGRLLKVDYPVMNDVIYEYGDTDESGNRAGRLMSVTDETGITNFYYGILGEQTRIVKDLRCVTSDDVGVERIFELSYTYDYLGRIENMIYPSTGHGRPGEKVSYEYDLGGQVKRVIGNYSDVIDDIIYVDNIMYDEFGQRVFLRYGNGVETRYTYDENRRWLDNILTTSTKTGKTIQNMDYTFDEVGNILSITNDVQDKVTHTYTYDELYQLKSATGSFEDGVFSSTDDYEQTYKYDKIGNMTQKISKQWNESGRGKNDLNYDFTYTYDNDHPHRAVKIGDINYDYDPNGNLVKKWKENNIVPNDSTYEDNEPNPNDPLADYENANDEAFGYDWSDDQPTETVLTEYIWDEENRLTKAVTGGDTVHFIYNAGGERVIKRVENKKEILYVDKIYQLQVGVDEDVITKHIFVGETRLVSKVSYEDLANNAETERRNTFWYHPDHLGSSNYITDRDGEMYEHVEYTPYGETWFEDGQDEVNEFISHKFTGKELDPETGLYYFGARYYDPKVSRWASADPIYDGLKDGLSIYGYCRNNPLKFVDPNGLLSAETTNENDVKKDNGPQPPPDEDKYYFTVHVLQPHYGSRRKFRVIKKKGIDGLSFGHAFVGLTKENSEGDEIENHVYGKHPEEFQNIIDSGAIFKGKVKGLIKNDKSWLKTYKKSIVSAKFEITKEQYENILKDISNDKKAGDSGKLSYNLKNDQCASWALNLGKKWNVNGINQIMSPWTPWQFDRKYARTFDAWFAIKKDILKLEGNIAPNPADLGENIRIYNNK